MGSHVLNVPQLFQLLLEIDENLAAEVRARGCPDCGGKFHCGDYPRKPRGCPQRFVEAYSKRTSLDCSKCRHRTTPPAVRFLPHRVYVSAAVVLVSSRRPPQRSWLARELGVATRTVERWRQWWRHRAVTGAGDCTWCSIQGSQRRQSCPVHGRVQIADRAPWRPPP
jgi:hypothetical protein